MLNSNIMTSFYIKMFIVFSLISCKKNNSKVEKDIIVNNNRKEEAIPNAIKKVDSIEKGYLFVDISDIYHNGGNLLISKEDGQALIIFKDKSVTIGKDTFDIIEDEVKYNESIKIESFFPEYGLFILRAIKDDNGVYKVIINESEALINGKIYGKVLKFKTTEQYVLDAYPNPTKSNPLRASPNERSEIIVGFESHSYISVEVKGDWLKIKDDKECYSGEHPSEENIIGWVRWKKEEEIILDVRHIC